MTLPRGKNPCPATLLARKLSGYVPITPDEISVLQELTSTMRKVRRRQDVVLEGRKYRDLFLVADGILMRYRIVRDGRRQVVNLVMPGDFAGSPGCFSSVALDSVKAMTDTTISVIPQTQLLKLFEIQPRLAAKIFWSFSHDAAIYTERLIKLGRRTATERIAHFLLELLTRLQMVGMAGEHSYHIPLSQEVISDALGLSLPYVNRVLHELSDEGLLTIRGQHFTINDVESLAAMADFETSYLKPQPIPEYAEGDSQRPTDRFEPERAIVSAAGGYR